MRRRLIVIAPLAILGLVLLAFIGGEVVKLLWNWLLPPLFGFREIAFWQALGLLVLSRILFGGFGFHGPRGPRIRGRMADRMAFAWQRMTPEERERFRQRLRERAGFDPATPGSQEP